MDVTIRNITKDNMRDFSNDHTISLPMEEEKLRSLLGDDEWIIVDSPVGEELTSIAGLNELLTEIEEDDLMVLSQTYTFDEIVDCVENGREFSIINFNEETACYNGGIGGIYPDEEWKGRIMFETGYMGVPFEYTPEMEDYINWDRIWTEAECDGWREVEYKSETYLVHMW